MTDEEQARKFFQDWAAKLDLAELLRETYDSPPFVEIEFSKPPQLPVRKLEGTWRAELLPDEIINMCGDGDDG